MSQITTHVLNTSTGRPAGGIAVTLHHKSGEEWLPVSNKITDNDGRIPDLVREGQTLETGIYRLTFETGPYFQKENIQSFYPRIYIEFNINDTSHYHVPLLLSPYGYSTYRGS